MVICASSFKEILLESSIASPSLSLSSKSIWQQHLFGSNGVTLVVILLYKENGPFQI